MRVGDRVSLGALGAVGTIYEIEEPWYRIRFDSGMSAGYMLHRLTLIQPEGEEAMPQYNVGDKVQMRDSGYFGPDARGQVGIVTDIRNGRIIIGHYKDNFPLNTQTVSFEAAERELTLVSKGKEIDVIKNGDIVYVVDREGPESGRIKRANVEDGVGYIVSHVTLSSGKTYIKVKKEGDNSYSEWMRVEGWSKTQPAGLFKFFMVIRDDAKQTGTRYPKYDDAVEASKELSSANPEHEFAILEAIVKVKAENGSFNADTLKG